MPTTYTSKLGRSEPAWFLRDNRVVNLPIGSVTVKSVSNQDGSPNYESVVYGFRIFTSNGRDFKEWLELDERTVFGTKEELLASL
jgi:hypothetical protein